jgi:hypothetical protein
LIFDDDITQNNRVHWFPLSTSSWESKFISTSWALGIEIEIMVSSLMRLIVWFCYSYVFILYMTIPYYLFYLCIYEHCWISYAWGLPPSNFLILPRKPEVEKCYLSLIGCLGIAPSPGKTWRTARSFGLKFYPMLGKFLDLVLTLCLHSFDPKKFHLIPQTYYERFWALNHQIGPYP